jgi:hypothetical protein
MAVTRISPSEYRIDTPGFEQHVFTLGSARYLLLPHAVAFARAQGAVLQSAREAVAFRIASAGSDGADRYQMTRTCALYFRDGGVFFVAFDDDPAQNILLARAQEGYDAHSIGDDWLVNKHDPLIRGALQRAELTGRVMTAPLVENVMASTFATDGTSQYGNNPVVRAIIGDLAERYAEFLAQRGCSAGFACVLTRGALEHLNIDEHTVAVRHVSLGSGDAIYADSNCTCGGRARGVRRNDTGNTG